MTTYKTGNLRPNSRQLFIHIIMTRDLWPENPTAKGNQNCRKKRQHHTLRTNDADTCNGAKGAHILEV